MSIQRLQTIFGIFLISIALAGCWEEDVVETEPVVRPVLSLVVADVETIVQDSYPGRAEAVREVNVGFEVSGKVEDLKVDIGDIVKEGDVLAILDPEPYVARIRALNGDRAAMEAVMSTETTELRRREVLLEKGHVSQSRLDDQVMVVRAAEAKIEAIDGALDAARINLNYTTLKAPFDGVISDTFVEDFENVVAKQPVVRLLDTTRIEMEVAVPETLISLEPFVIDIMVEYTSLPGIQIPAEITEIGREASAKSRTYPVTVVMDQPENAKIEPGMSGRATATVQLPETWRSRGIQVPSAAVFSPNTEDPDSTFVWVIDEQSSTVSAKPVQIEEMADRGLLVSGLDAGDRIVTAGANVITDGQEVRVITE